MGWSRHFPKAPGVAALIFALAILAIVAISIRWLDRVHFFGFGLGSFALIVLLPILIAASAPSGQTPRDHDGEDS